MPELVGQKIEDISIISGERVVVLNFQNKNLTLYLQFFRKKTNFFFLRKNKEILSTFKKNKKFSGTYFQLKSKNLTDPEHLTSTNFINYLKEHHEFPLDHILKRYFLHLTPILVQEIATRGKGQLNKIIKSYSPEELKGIFKTIQTLLDSCKKDEPRVYLENGYPIALTLTEFKQFAGMSYEIFSSVNEAVKFYIFRRIKLDRYIKKKAKLDKIINQKMTHLHGLRTNLQNMPDEHKQREYFQKLENQKLRLLICTT
jgi:predicted ribosome quality control (RQC) complex YloA/Tae2 family protein